MAKYLTAGFSWTKARAQKRVKAAREKHGDKYSLRIKKMRTIGTAHKVGYVIMAAKKR